MNDTTASASPVPPGAIEKSGVVELDGLDIAAAFEVGTRQLLAQQEHLDRINVFPVPDGDTGTNLALTLGSVRAALAANRDAHAGRTLTRIADAALDGARGNSGALLAQFLLGVGDHVGDVARLRPGDFAAAVANGARYARESMPEPREGTILTVLSEYAAAAGSAPAADFAAMLRPALDTARSALERTRNQLESLRKANVVDAGAQGFVELIDGVTRYIVDGPATVPVERALPARAEPEFASSAGREPVLAHRYCTECVITGRDVDLRRLRERLAALGSSVVVAGNARKAKVHVHVDAPAEIFRIARDYGEVSGEKADDLELQQHSTQLRGRRVAIVTDSAADLPDEEVERLDIHVVPVRVHFGDRSYLDKVGITPEAFFLELDRNPVHPKTSQPPPGDFRRQFEFLASHYPSVISINLTAQASGTHNAARVAAERMASPGRVTVVDSLNASVGQGLLVLDAAECAAAALDREAILARLATMIPRTRTFGLVGSLDYAVRGGRLPAAIRAAADFARVMPILANSRDGRVGAGGFLFGRQRLREKFARFVVRRLDRHRTWRVAVGHANARAAAEALLEDVCGHLPSVQSSYLMPLGSALGVHGGPGMLVIGLQEWEPVGISPAQ